MIKFQYVADINLVKHMVDNAYRSVIGDIFVDLEGKSRISLLRLEINCTFDILEISFHKGTKKLWNSKARACESSGFVIF